MENIQPKVEYDIYVQEVSRKRKLEPEEALRPITEGLEGFDQTDIGREVRERNALYQAFQARPMHPDVLRYWASRGLKKELFDNQERFGFDAPYAYSVFTPVDMDKAKKYALIYFCHGGGQPIEWAEHYGFNALAASEKYMVVYAQNGGRSNDEVDTEFPRIIGELVKKGYPIDLERIYIAGFSSGSEGAVAAACTCPELTAAVAVMPGGQPFKNLDFCTKPELYRQYRIPGIFIGGTQDIGNFPAPWIADYYGSGLGAGTVENALENLQIWLRDIAQAQSCPGLCRADITEGLLHGQDPVAREFGLCFDRAYTFRAQGTDWLGGDYYGADGAPVMRIIRAKGVPHVVWTSQANIVWDYLKHFRREPGTGRSIYDIMACYGER